VDEPAAATLSPPALDATVATPGVAAPARPLDALRRTGRSWWRRFVTDVRADADARADAARAAVGRAALDRQAAAVLVTTAVCLTITSFLATGSEPGWLVGTLSAVGLDGLGGRLERALTVSDAAELNRLAFWALVQIGGYLALPLVVARVVLHTRPADLGLRVRGVLRHGGPYVVLFLLALPLVVAASYGSAFQAKYPFYDLGPGEGIWPRLATWWVLYALQFVALETFFRGFLLHGLVPRFGYASLFVMIVPYNMIHYGKPMPEALAAIVGGLALGTLSLRTRSVWWGAALHVAIAGTMDALALWHAGVLLGP
jgi:membrane protease YdiL (CAAX protease family)